MNQFLTTNVETLIYNIRGQKVMLDHDLARLYGIETGALNRSVKRNIERFPEDFCFKLNDLDLGILRCQIGILRSEHGKHSKYKTFAFTELGIAMLSSVLRSEQAVQVNISIMRTLFKLRDLVLAEQNADSKIKELEKNTNDLFKLVFTRLEQVERNTPLLSPKRRKIGI